MSLIRTLQSVWSSLGFVGRGNGYCFVGILSVNIERRGRDGVSHTVSVTEINCRYHWPGLKGL